MLGEYVVRTCKVAHAPPITAAAGGIPENASTSNNCFVTVGTAHKCRVACLHEMMILLGECAKV